jgi:hypothetical protein
MVTPEPVPVQPPDDSPFGDLSPKTRRSIYDIWWALGALLGCITVAYAASNSDVPDWSVVANAIYAFASVPVGVLARRNVRAV